MNHESRLYVDETLFIPEYPFHFFFLYGDEEKSCPRHYSPSERSPSHYEMLHMLSQLCG